MQNRARDLRQMFTLSNRTAAPNGHSATEALMWSLVVTFSNIFAQKMICAEPWARSIAVSSLVVDSYVWDRTLNICREGIGTSGTIIFLSQNNHCAKY